MYFSQVWPGKRLVDFACCARTLRDVGRLTASVAITTKTLPVLRQGLSSERTSSAQGE